MSDPELPSVSIVVPVYDAQDTIEACVESLLRLDYPRARLELICVDNDSRDRTPQILRQFADRVCLLHETTRGAAAARNRGIRAAGYEVVAFTDADCTVDPGWLRALVSPLRDAGVGIAGGRIAALPKANFIERFGETIHDHQRAIEVFQPPYVITMSWASRRAVLLEAGLFDEALLRGQDVDLAYRIVGLGLRLVYVDTAVVYHRNERTLRGLFHEGYVHGYHAVAVRARHEALLGWRSRRQHAERAWKRFRNQMAQIAPDASWGHWLCTLVFNGGKVAGELQALRQGGEGKNPPSPASSREREG